MEGATSDVGTALAHREKCPQEMHLLKCTSWNAFPEVHFLKCTS